MNKGKETHESYGMLQINRVSSGNRSLFGSDIKHNNTITLRINPAEYERSLNSDYYFATRVPYIEIEMSPVQFAEAITNMNTQGVPCTIKQINGTYTEKCPFRDKTEVFNKEFERQMNDIANRINLLTNRTTEILNNSKAPKKSEKEEILDAIEKLKMEIRSNIPYIKNEFEKQVEKTVVEAKSEVEAYITHKVTSLGLKELQKQNEVLLGD
ncbi:hypothetical protein FDC62_11315 [Clostridium botulinum]|uniref:hypothetical protein n=1 Tax=Clostridium botulinum TaxID=1491 RepID=UPI0009946AD3|nr:hypothetical protein [Clostridium botulinum]NFO98772.1 hypothetical protein [Clostridium botulinum]OOV52312.1 hypothetical protein B1A66_04695 [Clostridium botulinum D/C]OOV54080.1 hypothetical protein B0673_11500 [Clostridium botulinum D/C]OOV58080.1 hypothetical protein B1A67_03535 [Clostridium botulinum D/C]